MAAHVRYKANSSPIQCLVGLPVSTRNRFLVAIGINVKDFDYLLVLVEAQHIGGEAGNVHSLNTYLPGNIQALRHKVEIPLVTAELPVKIEADCAGASGKIEGGARTADTLPPV